MHLSSGIKIIWQNLIHAVLRTAKEITHRPNNAVDVKLDIASKDCNMKKS
jgi:hypothetical protein